MQPVRNAVPLAHSARPTENGFNFTPEMHGNPQKDCSAFSCDQTFRFVAAFRTHGQKHPDAVKNRQRPRPDIVLSEIPIILPLRPSVASPAACIRSGNGRIADALPDGSATDSPFQNFHFEESEQVT